MAIPTLPAAATVYRRTPAFTELTVPAALTRWHDTKPGVWGRIVVEQGRLRYHMLEQGETIDLTAGESAVIEPQAPHKVEPLGAVVFFVEFLR
jgi:tellurite resistance-related uncharacterized protein